MNVTTVGCFRIAWYMGFFCTIEVIIPEEEAPSDHLQGEFGADTAGSSWLHGLRLPAARSAW